LNRKTNIKVKLNTTDKFRLVFTYCCSSKKSKNKNVKNFWAAKEIIMPKFEIIEIIKLVNIVHILKKILLNKDQKVILKKITDNINLNPNKSKDIKPFDININEAHKKMVESNNPVDKKLLKIIRQESMN
jgi:hypothetical protein